MKRILIGIVVTAAVLAAGPARAQVTSLLSPNGQEEKIPTVKFKLRPAAEPQAALEYQLLPGFLDRKPGNAAVIYNKIGFMMPHGSDANNLQERLSKWLETPLAELPREEIEKTLAGQHYVLESLDRAARRETCDWELPLREESLITMLLPELQETRGDARLLAVKARLEIAKGEFDEAIHTLQTGYALGCHVAEGPTLVSALVGMAICGIMSNQVEELMQQPGSPNLYWALTSLPRPIISVRKAAEVEMNMLYLMYPELREVDGKTRDAAYWRAFLDRASEEMSGWWGGPNPKSSLRPALTALAIKGYPQAKRALIEQGRSDEEVEAMPVAQVVLIYTVRTYDEFRDRIFKWFALPYWEALPGMMEADQYLRDEGRKREIFPIASLLLPAVQAAKGAEARTDRTIAALRVLEALRMHAAGHEGRLPSKLEDITAVPVPIDPMTGKPFAYTCDGNTAVLEVPSPEIPERGKRYEIEVAK
ncbi:MAG: hypothetical protein NTW96_09795 [Planctomycetia bacterium]|nr:hypothetical protein [Planctomycetia bacterium]